MNPGAEPSGPVDGASHGRWAPSPTGATHIGLARTALVAWLDARSSGGSLVWRVEDIDGPRMVPGAAEQQLTDLAWLGLDWDHGPDRGGPHAPYRQSERGPVYAAALERLAAAGRLFPCTLSRKDLAEVASAPHGGEVCPYPAELRPRELRPGWLAAHRAAGVGQASLRFRVAVEPVRFVDRIAGGIEERVDRAVGDFVLERRDGLVSYQLAVVVDDLAMGVDSVVRGADLVASTARQIQLIRALGGAPPRYAHVPLVVNQAGDKLSKRDRPPALAELAERGVDPRRVVGYLAWSLGLRERPEPCEPAQLIGCFRWQRIRREPWTVADAHCAFFEA